MGRACLEAKMKSLFLLNIFLILSSTGLAERVRTVRTHTGSCFSCGMIEGTSYLTVQICGTSDCCLSRSLDNEHLNWLPGQTDVFSGTEALLECSGYEVGSGPFTLTAFHDGPDGLTIDMIEVETDSRTVKCYIDHKLDDHSFTTSHCN